MSTAQYKYRPINQSVDEIRVLNLRPGSFDDPISCDLTHHRLQHDSDYEALSYCWGDPTPCRQISIGTASVMVTESAHCALRHLRFKDRPRRIWIDAICINQADTNEKNHQVQQMARIYKGAWRVLAWLGPARPGSNKAIGLVKAVVAKYDRDPSMKESIGEPIDVWQAVTALAQLLERPYWNRTWILQEIIGPKRGPLVGCGTCWVDWGTLASASRLSSLLAPKPSCLGRMIVETYDQAFEVFSAMDNLRHSNSRFERFEPATITMHGRPLKNTNIREMLTLSMSSKCSDIRDHVFAVFGMIHSSVMTETTRPPRPDYNKTVRQVYSEMTKFAIEADQELTILILRTHLKTPNGLPSWTPDFSCNDKNLRYPALSRVIRSVPGNNHHLPRVLDDGETLRVHGKIIGTIQQVLDLECFESGWWGALSRIKSFALPLLSHPELGHDFDSLLEELYSSLIGGQNLGGDIDKDGLAWFHDAMIRHDSEFFDDSSSESGSNARKTQVFEAARRTIALKGQYECPHRRLYRTINARFQVGLGTPDCQYGDLICLIAGGHAPMILRRALFDGYYHYVGDSFVPGHMEGDMERALAEDIGIEWKRFDII